MGLILKPNIFKPYGQIAAGMSLRGNDTGDFGFNMSTAIGDDPERVIANRRRLAERFGFSLERLAVQHQVHGDRILYVDQTYQPGDSDGLMTDQPGWLLAISVADCVPVLIAAPERGVVAGVHSGWRGSAQNIVGKSLAVLRDRFDLQPEDLRFWVGPSAGECCYEVGEDVAGAFNPLFSKELGEGKYLFDNRGAVVHQLMSAGVAPEHIEVDPRCTICDRRFQSWRRDGKRSGRMFAVIGMVPE